MTNLELLYSISVDLNIPVSDIISECRYKEYVYARMIYAVRADGTLRDISELINRNHASIIHYRKTFKNLVATKDSLMMRYIKKCNETIEIWYENSII